MPEDSSSSAYSSDEEDVEISTGDKSANNSASLKKTVGASVGTEISVAKRPRETSEGEEEAEPKTMDVKRVKKTYFQRLWSEKDEIAVLQGVLDYKKDTGKSPYDDTNEVYEVVNKSISIDVSKLQFKEKLRSLKKKYDRQIGKAKKKGEDPTFVKPLHRKVFELSKLLWGANGESAGKKSKKRREDDDEVMNKEGLAVVEERDTFIKSSVVESLTRFGMEEIAASQGWSWLSIKDRKKLEQEWKAFQLQKVELYSKESSFIQALMTKVGEAFKSNL